MTNAALHYTILAPSRLVAIALTMNWQYNGTSGSNCYRNPNGLMPKL